MTIDHSLKGGGADNCMTVWHYEKNCKYTKRDQPNFAKDLSVLQFDLKWSLAYRYGSLIKLNKIKVILLGLKMKALLIFMWNGYVKIWQYDGNRGGGYAKIWRLMTIGGVGVRQPSKMYDVIYGSSLYNIVKNMSNNFLLIIELDTDIFKLEYHWAKK